MLPTQDIRQEFGEPAVPLLTSEDVEGFFQFEDLTFQSNENPPPKKEYYIDCINNQWRFVEVVDLTRDDD